MLGEYEVNNIYLRKNDFFSKHKEKEKKGFNDSKVWFVIATICIWAGALVMVFPYFMMLMNSLKTNSEILSDKFILFPSDPQWSTYKELFLEKSFFVGIRNTLLIEIIVVPIGTLTSALAAFAFSKMQFRFKKTLLITLMTAMMIPGCSLLFSQFEMFVSLKMVGTDDFRVLLPFIIPGLFSRISMIFFLTTYMKNAIHNSLIESAKIDGASYLRIFFQIVIPLCKSAIAAQAIFWFVAIWNDYFGPSIYLNSSVDSPWVTLQVALMNFDATEASQGNKSLIFAGSTLASIPMIVFFLCFRNMFVQSTALSGVKE